MSKENKQELELGKRVEAPSHYSPTSLRRVPRSEEREKLFGAGGQLPFFGYDVWNAYEFNFLQENGGPRNFILKIIYPASSPYIVESKSLKLYLGSFSMDRYPDVTLPVKIIREDLSKLLEAKVQVSALEVYSVQEIRRQFPDEVIELDRLAHSVPCNTFQHDETLLRPSEREVFPDTHCYVFHGLKSNCKVTHQPDYGTLYLKIGTSDVIDVEALYRYLVSFRGENHFHEEIVETIFADLYKTYNVFSLVVFAQYTRRGGIDINPVRALSLSDLEWNPCKDLLLAHPGEIRSYMQ